MDEDQSKNKINTDSFFDQISTIDQIANTALSNSNNLQSQLNAVQLDLQRLIQSLQMNFDSSIGSIQNQINEVTNVIVDDQRMKMKEIEMREEQIFAEEDALQKQKPRLFGEGPFTPDNNNFQKFIRDTQQKPKRLPILPSIALGGILGLSNIGGNIGGNNEGDTSSDSNNNVDNSQTASIENGNVAASKETGSMLGIDKISSQGFDTSNFEVGTFGSQGFDTSNFEVGTFGSQGFDTSNIEAGAFSEVTGLDIVRESLLDLETVFRDSISSEGIKTNLEGFAKGFSKDKSELKNIKNIIINTVFEKLTGGESGRSQASETVDKNINKMIETLPDAVNKFSDFLDSDKIKSGMDKFKEIIPEISSQFDYKETSNDGQLTDSVINLPPEIIEGSNEVVNEEPITRRGDLRVTSEFDGIKSPSSTVTAINISEGNSIFNLNLTGN